MLLQTVFITFIPICIVLCGLHIAFLTKRDTYAMEKYTKVMTISVFSIAVMFYFLAAHTFKQDSTYFLQALLAFVMLVCLPATLISLSIATITAGNV